MTFSGSVRYRIVRRLGAGGMGVVYEACDRERRRRVVLKTLSFDDPGAIYRLKKEFRTLADVAHPNLISFHELVREGDTWFITMELIEGGTFLAYVRPGREERIPSAAGDGAPGILDLELLRVRSRPAGGRAPPPARGGQVAPGSETGQRDGHDRGLVG